MTSASRDDDLTLDAFSYGGGVQSTAALVLAATGRLDCRLFLFANVGEDSETPETLEYVRSVSMPYAAANGVEVVELHPTRFGKPETLKALLLDPSRRSLPIPARGTNGGPVGRRACTRDFKIRVVDRELRGRGFTRAKPARVGLGISVDEAERANSRPTDGGNRTVYPLLTLGLSRGDCLNVIEAAGLPAPGKSACYFCPFTRLSEWSTMRETQPERFAAAAELERAIGDKQVALGRDRVFLTRYKGPLEEVVQSQLTLDSELDDNCEGGFCFT